MQRIYWLDALLTPLTLLERTRGRRRLALLGLYGLILLVGGVLVGREAVLWRLPAAPEPFDLERYGHVSLPDSDNAMVLYREAGKLLVRDDKLFRDLPKGAGNQRDWTPADPKVRAWAESNRAALDVWLRGTARPGSVFVQPERYTVSTVLDTIGDLRTFAHLAELEATKRQASGDLAGAWTYHRGVIRSCLHAARHGGIMCSLIGNRVFHLANPSIWAWIDDPRLTPDLIRRAVADLAECRTLRTSTTDVLRVEYFANRAALGDPSQWGRWEVDPSDPNAWYNHFPGFLGAKAFLRNEPKRSLKIYRLITAGQLAQAERPAADRPRVVVPQYPIYAIDAATPPPLRRIKPEDLAAWADASGCRGVVGGANFNSGLIQGNANLLDTLRLRVAEPGYALDHGGQLPPTHGDLLGAYLDALPAGIAPEDRLVAP